MSASDGVCRYERGVGRQNVGDLLLVLEKDRGVLQDLGEPGLLAAAKPLIGELRIERQQREILERARLILRRAAEQFGERLRVVAVGTPGGFIVGEGGLVLVDDASESFQKAGVLLREGAVATQAEKVGAPLSATSFEVTITLPFFFSSVSAGSHTKPPSRSPRL